MSSASRPSEVVIASTWRGCAEKLAPLLIDDDLKEDICGFSLPAVNAVHKKVNGEPQLGIEGGAEAFYELMRRKVPSTWIVKPQRRCRLENQDAQHSVGVMCESTSVVRFHIRKEFVLRRIVVEVQWCRAIEKLCESLSLRTEFWARDSV